MHGVAFGDGDPARAEGGGFPKVGIGEDEGGTEQDGVFRQESEFVTVDSDCHGGVESRRAGKRKGKLPVERWSEGF